MLPHWLWYYPSWLLALTCPCTSWLGLWFGLVLTEHLTFLDDVFPFTIAALWFAWPVVVLVSTLISSKWTTMLFATISKIGKILAVLLGVVISLDRWVWYGVLTETHLVYSLLGTPVAQTQSWVHNMPKFFFSPGDVIDSWKSILHHPPGFLFPWWPFS